MFECLYGLYLQGVSDRSFGIVSLTVEVLLLHHNHSVPLFLNSLIVFIFDRFHYLLLSSS
jgi:hypothetical protein